MATAKQIAARAWEIGPTWKDVAALALVDLTLVAWWDLPWLAVVLATMAGCVVVFGTLGWLDLQNEEFDQANLDPDEAD